nr:PREDICTED: coiled-coil domain-containing protein 177 [Bemisia tabaci]
MTNCRKKMPVVPLNLNNFESSIISAGCPYVLTSPRSLRACKKAGIKPVELLYQSTSQIADDLGVHPKYVTDVFLQRETDRQKKLDLVRKIRNDIIADETLIKSLDLAHHKDNLTCLSTCSRGNRTPTSLRRRHHSSLHHLKGLAEHTNHGSSPSISSILSSHSPAFQDTSRSFHSQSRHTSPVLRSKSTEAMSSGMREIDNHLRLCSEEESIFRQNQNFPYSPSENNTPSPRFKHKMTPDPACKSRNSPSTPRSKSVPCFPPMPLVSVSSTPDYYAPNSTDTVSTPRSKIGTCHPVPLDSHVSRCTSDLSQSPENYQDRIQLVSDFLSQAKTKCLKKKKTKGSKCKSFISGTKLKTFDGKESKNKQVAFEENLKKEKKIDAKTRSKPAAGKNARQKYYDEKENSSRRRDGNESCSSRGSSQRNSGGSVRSKRCSQQTEVSKPKRKLNEHRKSKYGRSESDEIRENEKERNEDQIKNLTENKPRGSHEHSCSVMDTCGKKSNILRNSFVSSLRATPMNISNHDLRILESMAMKKEQERANKELAYQVQQRWEADRLAKAKFENELKNKWQKYIQEKRQLEQNMNRLKMEEVKLSLHESQKILEENLRMRDEKVQRSLQEMERKRMLETMTRHEQCENRKTQLNANQHQQKSLDTLKRFHHIEEMDNKLEQAEINRQQLKANTYKKIVSGNRLKCLKHMTRMEELLTNEAITRKQKLEECHRREERAWQRYTDQVHSRLQQLKMNSALRELRSEQVRSLARELDQGLERWQDHVMILQWQAVQRAEASASIQLQTKRLKTECENRERQLQHAQRFKRVKAFEAEKEKGLRELITAKESRIRALQLKKERDILECKAAAHSTAELREHLRESLTPETFDRKVTKVAVEMRVCNRPATASPTMMGKSHIRLG